MPDLVLSYARKDRDQVRAVVNLLRASYPTRIDKAVFWDEDFAPGEDWFGQLAASIDAAPQLFVFWCRHSARSTQVAREVRYALDRGKRVVPVLLDRTRLPQHLASIHAVDLRGVIHHRRRYPQLLAWGAAAVASFAAYLLLPTAPEVSGTDPFPLPPPPPPVADEPRLWMAVVVATVIVVVAGLQFMWRKARTSDPDALRNRISSEFASYV